MKHNYLHLGETPSNLVHWSKRNADFVQGMSQVPSLQVLTEGRHIIKHNEQFPTPLNVWKGTSKRQKTGRNGLMTWHALQKLVFLHDSWTKSDWVFSDRYKNNHSFIIQYDFSYCNIYHYFCNRYPNVDRIFGQTLYTGWPRKNATTLIVSFKNIVDETELLSIVFGRTFIFQQNDTMIINFGQGVWIL